jgi:HEAT repeat protein
MPPLVKQYHSAVNAKDRHHALAAMAYCFPGDDRTKKILKSALHDKNDAVREKALISLPWHTKEALFYLPDLSRRVDDSNIKIAASALRIGGYASEHHGFLGNEFLKRVFLAVGRKELRVQAILELGRIGGDSPESLDILINSLKQRDDPEVVCSACQALQRLGPKAAPALTPLIDLLKEAEPRIKTSAANTLARMGIQAKQAVPYLVAMSEDHNQHNVQGALWALQAIDPEAYEKANQQRKLRGPQVGGH